MSAALPKTGAITKRLLVCLIGCAMVWWFQHVHRDWVWAYFESIMLLPKHSPELAKIAEASISAITTIAITGITAISAIAMFFITGNVAVLTSMFKFSAAGTAAASVASESISEYRRETSEHTERIIDEGTPGAPERRPWAQTPAE